MGPWACAHLTVETGSRGRDRRRVGIGPRSHFMFPKQLWAELFEQGRIVQHPVFPGREGPAARRIEDDSDVDDVIELLRLNYARVTARRADETPAFPR